MRGLILLLLLAGAFGLAAWWQDRHLSELQAQRRQAEAEADGIVRRGDTGTLGPGEAVLIVGRPSGATPRPRPQAPSQESPGVRPAAPDQPPVAEIELGDFSLEVQSGQTLSGIAYLRYGRSGPGIVRALAAYNGLADPDELRAGQVLRLPALEALETPGEGR
jgi:nucleoid-associated protein YgaU